MSIVLAVPYVPPIKPPDPFQSARHKLIGWDGTEWDISDYETGVFLTTDGIRGMGRPAWDLYHSTSPVVPGARYHGSRVPIREPHLPLFLYHDGSSAGWTERYRAFMRIMHPDRPLQWTVSHPETGESRSLYMRFTDPGDDVETQDSRWRGWRKLGLNFVADERPHWEGTPVVQQWQLGVGQDFIPSGGAPPFYISSGTNLATANIANPGDEPAWPVWDIEGPMTSVTVGVDGRFITAPIELEQGESLRIDTRPGPRGKSVYDNTGARRTPELTQREWFPIPPGARVPLSIEMAGTGTVRVTLTPLFLEAY